MQTTAPDPILANYRHNFIVNVLDVAFFFAGYSFLSSSVILPLFVSNLSDSKLLIGLVGMIGATGYFLPQLFTARWVERSTLKRDIVVKVGFFTERLPTFFLPLAALVALRSPVLALFLFFFFYAAHAFGAGSVAVAWQEMIAKIFPPNRRGFFMGLGTAIGTGTGVLGALGAAWLLDRFPFPYGYLVCFALAGFLIFLSWLSIRLTREVPSPAPQVTIDFLTYFLNLPSILRQDHNFRWFLLAQAMIALGGMAWIFMAVFARNRWGLSDGMVGTYNTALLIGQAGGNLLFGLWGDRRGYLQVLLFSVGISALALLVSIFASSPAWMYLVFALRGLGLAGSFLAILIVLEFCPEAVRPTYIGINSTAMGFMGILAPLAGSWLAQVTSYPAMFSISAAFTLIGLALLGVFVREPRHAVKSQPPVEAALDDNIVHLTVDR